MKKLSFSYKVHYTFSCPVTDHCYALRILPKTNEEQGVYASEYTLFGGNSIVSEGRGSLAGEDGFGNRLISGIVREPHESFDIQVTGTAYIDRSRLCRRVSDCPPMYRYSTDLTRPGPAIHRLWMENRAAVEAGAEYHRALPGGFAAGCAIQWMHVLYETYHYAPGHTGIHTTAEEALRGGFGVCQDYAHILIALLRLSGIPARYVAGMMIGEGASHAWCQAWCEGYWLGLDPTHDIWLTDDYVEVAVGRDYRDCIMDRGIFRGYALQTQEVSVLVQEMEPPQVGRWRIL